MAVVEFALVMPVLMLLVVAATEIGGSLLLNQRLENAAAQVGDLVSQEERPSVARLADIFASVAYSIGRPGFDQDGVVIVSAVGRTSGGGRKLLWQLRGAGQLAEPSRIGVAGGAATLPPALSAGTDRTLLAVELFYRHQELTGAALSRKTAFFVPRAGDLAVLLPD